MKKINIVLLFLLLLNFANAKSLVIDNLGESDTRHINLSRSDTNRFVFPSKIKTHVGSAEKDLLVTITGNEMFIKFTPYQMQEQVKVGTKTITQGTNTIVYNKAKKNELFVVTKDKTYSFMLHPKKQESTTVFLTESFKNKIKNIKKDLSSDTDYVKKIANNIILTILRNAPLKGYEVNTVNKTHNNVYIPEIRANMGIKLNKTYKGYKYLVKEYEITNLNDFILSIPDTKQLLYSIVKRKELLVAYSLYYDNRIYKILPKDKAKLVVITYNQKG